MQQLIYVLQFRGRVIADDQELKSIRTTAFAPSCTVTTVIDSDGVFGAFEPVPGEGATFEAEVSTDDANRLRGVATYRLVPRNSVAHELSGWLALGHGLLLILCLMPLPVTDGGTLLKWTLVARGRSEAEADEMVRRIDLGMAALGGVVGSALISHWISRGGER